MAASFKVTKEEFEVINDIARRARSIGTQRTTVMDWQMDITAVHANGCPLRLVSLRDADDFNFTHDVFGIRRHLNRETGQLENCFVPRFAQPAAE